MKTRLGYPIRLALYYTLIGGLWILCTDRLAAVLFTNPNILEQANTYKGWFFILVTAVLLYMELRREARVREHDEAALRESEEKYRRLFDSAVLGIFQSTPQGKAISVNPAFARMFGYDSPEDAIDSIHNVSTDLFVDPNRRVEIIHLMEQNPDLKTFENLYRRKDGSTFIGNLNSMVIRDSSGQLARIEGIIEDITERKQVEKKLRTLSTRQEAILAAVPDILMEVNNDKVYTWANPAGLAFFGEDVVGKDAAFYFEGEQDTYGQVRPLFNGSKDLIYVESWQRRKDGEKRLLAWWCRVLKDIDGNVTGALSSAHDITDSKQAEEALRKSEANLIEAMKIARLGNWEYDVGLDQFTFNDQFYTLFHTTAEQEGGYTMSSAHYAQKFVHPDDGAMVGTEIQKALQTNDPDYYSKLDHCIICADGEIHYITVHIRVDKDVQGRTVKTYGVNQDITERMQAEDVLRENEQRLASIYDTVEDVIIYLTVEPNEQFRFTSVNPAFGRVTGLPSEQVIGRKVNEIIPEPSLSMVLGKYRQAIEERSIVRWEETSDYPTGRLVGEVSVAPIFDGAGNCTHLVGTVHDITERKQAEKILKEYSTRLETNVVERTRELQNAQEQLVRQEKLAVLGQLAGGVGHELRNPLAIINNAVYYLKLVQPDADDKTRQYFGMIEREVRTAEKIITDLLDFARIKSVDREPVVISELVHSVLERFPVPKSVTATLKLPADLPPVYADPRQMEQVLGNLVVNACQAMGDGGKLTISAKRQKELVAIAVKDTGTGITSENMQKIFEPLFTTKIKGIGLGLAVSKKLAEANEGRIEVQSEPGNGSTFTVFLPVYQKGETK